MKNIKIHNKQFEEMQSIKYVTEPREVKNAILEAIIDVMGDTYYNLAEGTQRALDKLCFLAMEKGFVYASPSYLMEKCGISQTTIYQLIKRLRDLNLVIKTNRSSRKHNGLGKWVIIFTEHPNFKAICKILDLEWKADEKAERKAETVENVDVPTVEEDNSVSTYSLPNLNLKDLNKHSNVNRETKIVKYVPKVINDNFASIFSDNLCQLWKKITFAIKNTGISMSKEVKEGFGLEVLKALFVSYKKKTMSLDEMCAFVYKVTRNMVMDAKAKEFMDTMIYDEEVESFMYEDINSFWGRSKTLKKALFVGQYDWISDSEGLLGDAC